VKNFSLKSGFLTAIKIWASAWIAFFISLIPMYIWRIAYKGNYDNKIFGENIIMAMVGLVASFFILMMLHGKSDEAEQLTNSEMWLSAGESVGIYLVVWMLVWAFIKNNYLVACCGYHLEIILGLNENSRPTFFSATASALIYGFVYFFAIVLGTKMAQKRRR